MRSIGFMSVVMIGLLLTGCSSSKNVVSSFSEPEIATAVQEQSYQFFARFVQPASGRMRNITGSYTLTVTPDKIKADLPYFGRAYSAPLNGEGGIKFESNDFEYSESTTAKGVKEIAITIKDSREVKELYLTIQQNGNADLRITPMNKQFISYRGEVLPTVKTY